ncbi:dienelactone hydrolase family protein-like protein [Halenospora varia]|nr:dienelactone hydrolase family protein-like protein [Halenospora varia]
MDSIASHSVACCSIPPIAAKDYVPKGEYKTIGGLKTYVTGHSSSPKGIFIIYDIFSYSSQILQGADILSTSDKNQQYQVFIPDLLDGQPADKAWFPPNTEEKKQALGEFFKGVGAPSRAVARLPDLIAAFEKEHANIQEWAAIGFCWGGKVISLTSSSGTPWKAAAIVHPAMLDPANASGITIPFGLLASKDEAVEDVRKFEQNLEGPKIVKTFGDQIHGFMAARGDLEDKAVLEAYQQGYQTLLGFLAQYL